MSVRHHADCRPARYSVDPVRYFAADYSPVRPFCRLSCSFPTTILRTAPKHSHWALTLKKSLKISLCNLEAHKTSFGLLVSIVLSLEIKPRFASHALQGALFMRYISETALCEPRPVRHTLCVTFCKPHPIRNAIFRKKAPNTQAEPQYCEAKPSEGFHLPLHTPHQKAHSLQLNSLRQSHFHLIKPFYTMLPCCLYRTQRIVNYISMTRANNTYFIQLYKIFQ